jgi:hypothetical protein
MGADDRRDEVLVGAIITRQYRFLFVLPFPEIALPNVTLSTPMIPLSLAQCERANNSSEHQSIPPSPLTPTPHLEQPRGTPHGASPTFSFPTRSAPPSPTSFGGAHGPTR